MIQCIILFYIIFNIFDKKQGTWCENREGEGDVYVLHTERKTSKLPAAVTVKGSYRHIMFSLCGKQESLSEVNDPRPTFPTKEPLLKNYFYIQSCYYTVQVHMLFRKYPAGRPVPGLARCFFDINKVRPQRPSGQQSLDLLRGSGQQVLWVFVGIRWAGQCCVNLPIGPAHQLC